MFNVTRPARRPLENARLAGVYRFLIPMTLPNVMPLSSAPGIVSLSLCILLRPFRFAAFTPHESLPLGYEILP
jgi:hypothetical protein